MAVIFINWLILWPHLNRLDNFFSYYTLTAYYQAGMPNSPLPVTPWFSHDKDKALIFVLSFSTSLSPLLLGQASSLFITALEAFPTQGREFPKLAAAWTTPESPTVRLGGWGEPQGAQEFGSALTQGSEQHKFSGKTLLPLYCCLIDFQNEIVPQWRLGSVCS